MIAPGKLLIVDDELSVRDSLAKWFHEEGYDVGAAEDANGALTRMAEQHWDAALVDIKMRGTDGIELQRRMQLTIDPGPIVIMMTGGRVGRDRRRRAQERRLRLRHRTARPRRDCPPGQ